MPADGPRSRVASVYAAADEPGSSSRAGRNSMVVPPCGREARRAPHVRRRRRRAGPPARIGSPCDRVVELDRGHEACGWRRRRLDRRRIAPVIPVAPGPCAARTTRRPCTARRRGASLIRRSAPPLPGPAREPPLIEIRDPIRDDAERDRRDDAVEAAQEREVSEKHFEAHHGEQRQALPPQQRAREPQPPVSSAAANAIQSSEITRLSARRRSRSNTSSPRAA